MSKIAAAVTSRDAAMILPDLFHSLEGQVDEIVVGVDDRTIDNTREVASAAGARVFDVNLVRDRVTDFSQGRTQTLTHVSPEMDWFIWIDSDDVLAGGPDGSTSPQVNLHQLVDEAGPDVESIWIPYLYTRDRYGHIAVEHYRERVIRMDAEPSWQSRLHETCHTKGGPTRIMAEGRTEDGRLDRKLARILVDHRNQPLTDAGKWDRNYPILLKMLEEDPKDLRVVREIAEANFAATNWATAIQWFSRFIDSTTPELSPGTPLEERWQAIIYLAKAQRMTGQVRDGLRTADRALLMCPQYADSYFELAYGYLMEGRWTKAVWWFKEGEGRERPSGVLHSSPLDYDLIPYRTIHHAYYQLGDLEKAIECAKRALDMTPDDGDLQHALDGYTNWYNRKTIVDAVVQTAQYLIDNNEPLKAENVLDNVPAGSNEEYPQLSEIRVKVNERLAHLRSPIAYRNFYLAAENEVDAVAMLEKGEVYPRMLWLVERLRANGCKRVLNVGIGSGFDSLLFAKNGITTVGIDVDPKRVKDCNFAAVRAGFLSLRDAPEHTAIQEIHEHETWTAGCEKCGPVTRLPDINYDSPVQFWPADMENITHWVKDLGPYDAVVMAELLEHVRDVPKVIEQAEALAPLVIITTPDGTAPQIPYPSHVRSWSKEELLQEFWSRGRVMESHLLIDDPDQIALEYRVGEKFLNKRSAVIYCGPGLEPWTPDHIDATGLGGAETAVVRLARELIKRGLHVIVYAEAEGTWDGVFYRHYSKFVPENPVWMFIAWRDAAILDEDVAAERKYIWVHDVVANRLTPERDAKVNGYWVLSEWHKRHMQKEHPFVDESKYVIIGNGIDPDRFAVTQVTRDPYRFAYLSSPDRGLERVLAFWPFVKKAIPQASLQVFYGWENYDRMGRDRQFKDWIMDMAKAPGVEWHGRIGQRHLAYELSRCGALLYPGPHPFEETFCIAALEAQAAGCVPVTRDNGALPETNRYGILLSNPSATVNDYIQALKDSVRFSDEQRTEMSQWALTQTWDAVAERLAVHLREALKETVAA